MKRRGYASGDARFRDLPPPPPSMCAPPTNPGGIVLPPPPPQVDWDLVACREGCSRPWLRRRWRGRVWTCPACRTPWIYDRGWVEAPSNVDVLAGLTEFAVGLSEDILRDTRPYVPPSPTVADVRAAVESVPRQTIYCAPQDEHTIRAAAEALSSRPRVVTSPLIEPGTVYVTNGEIGRPQ